MLPYRHSCNALSTRLESRGNVAAIHSGQEQATWVMEMLAVLSHREVVKILLTELNPGD